jgi:predicted permease
MIAQPLLMLGLVALAGIHGVLGREAVVDVAFPAGFIAPMLASRYKTYESEAGSTLVLTVVLMMIVVPVLLAAMR